MDGKKLLICLLVVVIVCVFSSCNSSVEEPKYTVKFDSNGHGEAPASILGLSFGSKVKEPEFIPSADGFVFEGWFKDASGTKVWDFATDIVPGDITLYAKWTISMPSKGDLITLNGQEDTYRVIKVDGTIVEVLCLSGKTKAFNSECAKINTTDALAYEDSDVDTYCNTEFLESLSHEIQEAIVPKVIHQGIYAGSSSTFIPRVISFRQKIFLGDKWTTPNFGLYPSFSSRSMQRNVYILDVQDIVDYLGEENLTAENYSNMFFGSDLTERICWLRSGNNSEGIYVVENTNTRTRITSEQYDKEYEVLPAFMIDLSKCSWQNID